MKNFILILLASILLISCSSNSSSDIPSNTNELLPKTLTDSGDSYYFTGGTTTNHYNGNKITSENFINGNYYNFTYQGDVISQEMFFDLSYNTPDIFNFTYANNKLISYNEIHNNIIRTHYDYIYNSDGTTTEIETSYSTNNAISGHSKYKYYFSLGNITNVEELNYVDNSIIKTTFYTYDDKINPHINITGRTPLFYSGRSTFGQNNCLTEITKDSNNNITKTVQHSFQYNSSNYPTNDEYVTIEKGSNITDSKQITYY